MFEKKLKNKGEFFGRDEHFNAVVVSSDENLIGKIKKVEIINGNHNTLYGKVKNINNSNIVAA